jgi:hypothetical protein
MPEYCTFLVDNPNNEQLMRAMPTPSDWSILLIPDPSERFYFSRYCKSIKMHLKFDLPPKSDENLGLLLVVSSNLEDDGINAVDLI